MDENNECYFGKRFREIVSTLPHFALSNKAKDRSCVVSASAIDFGSGVFLDKIYENIFGKGSPRVRQALPRFMRYHFADENFSVVVECGYVLCGTNFPIFFCNRLICYRVHDKHCGAPSSLNLQYFMR